MTDDDIHIGPRMQFHITGRGQGKTTQMLQWMSEAPEAQSDEIRVCVSPHPREAMRLLRLSREMGLGLRSWQFVSIDELNASLWSSVRGRRNIVLGFDNLELILSRLIPGPWPVRYASATGTLVETKENKDA